MKQGMRYFQELGDKIDDAWKKSLLDERAFPAIAEAALLEKPPHLHVDPVDVVEWGMTARSIGIQQGGGGDFGEPPMVVYRARRFYIEVLFWFDGTTAIHQHGFDGAFCVLAGSSVHSQYDFHEAERTSTRLVFGDVAFRSAELLRQGSVHQILSADRFIHALFHLDHPSVSIVIRTDFTPGGVQYSYLPPYVGFDPFDTAIFNRRVQQYMRVLRTTTSPRAAELTKRSAEVLDDHGLMRAISILAEWRDEFVLGAGETEASDEEKEKETDPVKIAAAAAAEEKRQAQKEVVLSMYDACREVCKARFKHLEAPLMASIEESIRAMSLVNARARVHDPELRFFLALLMNVPDRTRLLELVKERFPDADPVDTILRWLGVLSDGNQLEYELGEDTLQLLGFMIRGSSPREAAQKLATLHGREFTPEETESVEATMAELTKVEIFRALLVTERFPRFASIAKA